MDDTSGFYFADGRDLYFGPNFVSGPTFELLRERPEDHDNSINGSATTGWYWFDTEAEAKTFFGIVDPPPADEPPADPVEP